jgi:microcompartment protein CcmL/EutN
MDALGMIECQVFKGNETADPMLKTAAVSLLTAQAVCAGNYIVLISGDVAPSPPAWTRARRSAARVIDSLFFEESIRRCSRYVACSDVPNRAAGYSGSFSLCV